MASFETSTRSVPSLVFQTNPGKTFTSFKSVEKNQAQEWQCIRIRVFCCGSSERMIGKDGTHLERTRTIMADKGAQVAPRPRDRRRWLSKGVRGRAGRQAHR